VKLSAVVATRNGAGRLPALLEKLRELADELVVLVDSTTSDDTAAVAAKAGASVHSFVHDVQFTEMKRQMLTRCSGDWILNLDDDDMINARWNRASVDDLMNDRSVTHYWFTARDLVAPGNQYIRTAPWYPDWIVRMFRNIPSIIVVPSLLHESWRIAGEPRYHPDLHIYHHDYVWNDRAAREAKLAAYRSANPENPGEKHTLYEDYYYELEPVRNEDAEDPAVVYEFRSPSGNAVDTYLHDVPVNMTVSQSYGARVSIANGSSREMLPQSEYIRWGTLELATRWFREGAAGEAIGPASAVPFPARIGSGQTIAALATVTAPDEPGDYWLAADVREGDAWLSQTGGGFFERKLVRVGRLVWPPSRRLRPASAT
jgi:glycosyltransferase involved in cell wall biosynthesis